MKSIVIIYCILLFCSKFVDSISPSKYLVRQRAYPVFDTEENQYVQNGQYLDTDLAQSQIKDTWTNTGVRDYLNQGYGLNKKSDSSLSEKELLVDYDSTADEPRLESYPPRVESHLSRTSHFSIDNQRYINHNWKPQNQYTNFAQRTVHVPGTFGQSEEPYRGPKYISSLNRRSHQAERLPRKEQYRYPSADNFDDSTYVVNSRRLESSGPVPYDRYNEEQPETFVIKTNPTGSRKYVQNYIPQSEIMYNEPPVIIDAETSADEAEKTENNSGDNKSVVISPSHFKLSGPVLYDIYDEDQVPATSEIKARSTGSQKYVKESDPEFGVEYNEGPTIHATDDLINHSENIKYNFGDNKHVVNPLSHFGSSDTEPYDSYSEEHDAISETKTRPRYDYHHRYLQNSAPKARIIYNKGHSVTDIDTLADQPKNNKNIKKHKTRRNLSETISLTNYDGPSDNSHSRRKNIAPVNKIKAPAKIINHLSEMPLDRMYANNYRPNSELSINARDDSSENIEIESRKTEANYEFDNGPIRRAPINTYSKALIDTVLVNSENNKYDDSKVPQYRPHSPIPVNTYPSQNVHHKSSSRIKEYNVQNIILNLKEKNIAAANKNIAVVHPNGTVEHVDVLKLESHQNSKLRLIPSDGVLTSQSPVNVAKTTAPVDAYLLPKNREPSDDKHVISDDDYSKPLPLYKKPTDENSSNFTVKELPGIQTHFKSRPLYVKQSTHDKMSKESSTEPADDDDSQLSLNDENQPRDDNDSKLLSAYKIEPVNLNESKLNHSNVNQSKDDDNSKPIHTYRNQLRNNGQIEPLLLRESQPEDDTNSKLLRPLTKQPSQRNKSKSKVSHDLPADDVNSKLLPQFVSQSTHYTQIKKSHVIQPVPDVKSESSYSYENQTTVDSNIKHLLQNVNQSANVKNETESDKNTTSPKNQTKDDDNNKYRYSSHSIGDDNSKQPPYENQPEDDVNSEQIPPNTKKPSHPTKLITKHSDDKLADDDNGKLWSQESILPADDKESKSLHLDENYDKSKLLRPYENQQTYRNKSRSKPAHVHHTSDDQKSLQLTSSENQSEDDENSESLQANVYKPAQNITKSKSKPTHKSQPADKKSEPLVENKSKDENNSKSLQSYANEPTYQNISTPKNTHVPADDDNLKPLQAFEKQPARNSSKHFHENKPINEKNNEDQLKDDINSEPHGNRPSYRYKLKSTHSHVHQPAHDTKSTQSTLGENQSEDDDKSESLQANVNQSEQDKIKFKAKHIQNNQPTDDENSKPLVEIKPEDNSNSKSLPSFANPTTQRNKPTTEQSQEYQTEIDNFSKPLTTTQHENQSVNDENSKLNQNQTEDDYGSKPLHSNENQPKDDFNSTPSSSTANKNDKTTPRVVRKHKHRQNRRKPSTKSPAATTPHPDGTEDQIITLSPIEQTAANVSDVPLVTTTTTTKPVKNPEKDVTKDVEVKQDNKQAKSSPEDVASRSHKVTTISSNSSALRKDDEAVVDTIIHKYKQTKDKTDVNPVNEEKNYRTATYNLSELLDTNTDVSVESDDSSVTTSTSVHNDVNTRDNDHAHSSELEESESDVIITDSSSTANDSEDGIVTINIKVSGSTDDADLSSDEKMLLESIDTEDDRDDSSETKDLKKRRINNEGKNKNYDIDLTNLNQEFLDQLIDNDEAEIDVIIIIQIDNQPIIERERETTRFCNGTVLIETTETIYEYKDDPTPTLKKTMKLIEIED